MVRSRESFFAAILFGVILFFSTDKLIETPPTWFDEGVYLQTSMNDSLYGALQIQVAPGEFAPAAYVTGGFPILKPVSWSFDLFGLGIFQARAVMVLFILATCGIFFALLLSFFGARTAVLSLLLLALFPPLYGQGKNVLGEVPGLFFLGLFLFSVAKLERNKFTGPWWYLLGGISAGLCVASKPIFILLGPAVLVTLLIKRKSIVWRFRECTIAFLAFLIPISLWYILQFSKADSLTQILGYYSNPYAIEDLNAQIVTNALRFFTESNPQYFFVLMIIWSSGIFIAWWKNKHVSISECLAWLFSLLVLVAFLRTAGWYRYFFVAEIPALLFAAPSLFRVSEVLPSTFFKRDWFVYGVIALFTVAQVNQLLFGSWVAQHSARTTSRDLGAYFSTLPATASFFVYNIPAAVIFLPSQNYYQYLELNPHVALGKDKLGLIVDGTPDYLVMSGSRWENASSTMSRYKLIKNIDDVAVAVRINR